MLEETNFNPDDDEDDDDFEESNPQEKPFLPTSLDRTVIAIPLLKDLKREDKGKKDPEAHDVIIDLNLEYPEGREAARTWVVMTIANLLAELPPGELPDQFIKEERGVLSPQYVFARLRARAIRTLVVRDAKEHDPDGTNFKKRAIYHIWPDFEIRALTNRSISTVKADAARASFAAFGEGIVWAVLDSGIQFDHPHFEDHKNLVLEPPLEHFDFTGAGGGVKVDNPVDPFGHGTHVAGIIGGEIKKKPDGTPEKEGAVVRSRDENGKITYQNIDLKSISGMAPKCRLISMRVLDQNGQRRYQQLDRRDLKDSGNKWLWPAAVNTTE
jgi:subtilisin family serine protease